jgi:hypothetical protein
VHSLHKRKATRDVDVLFVGTAAIANAVCHATGTRIRSLPISIEKMLGHESATSRMSSSLEAIAATTASARNDGI